MWSRFPKFIHGRISSWTGEFYLNRLLERGLPARFQLPLLYLLNGKLNVEDRSTLNKIEVLRSKLAEREDEYVNIYPSPDRGTDGAPISIDAKPAPGTITQISLKEIARTTSVLPYWGTFLYLCANANHTRTILELGGCAGISGCYLASGKSCNRFITIEGSSSLANLAKANLSQITTNFEVIPSLFSAGLDQLLPTLNEKLDMVYIDGHHEKKATLHYVERLKQNVSQGCIFVFDDIRWTPDMWEAWQDISKYPEVTCTLDTGRFGICEWNGKTFPKKHFDFSRFTDLWRAGKPR
jgi:predicted O-methyltransferase YrrM